MRSVKRRFAGLVCVSAGIAALFVGGLLFAGVVRDSLTIGGNATAPVSGVKAPLDVTFTNGYDFPVSVSGLTVTVRDVRTPLADAAHACTAADFVVEQLSSTVAITVGAHVTSSLSSLDVPSAMWPRVGILPRASNQDACKGASLTIGYAASRTLELL